MNGASPLTILYQDEWLIAVDKPAGQLVHPADIPQEDDQVTMKILRDQIGAQVRAGVVRNLSANLKMRPRKRPQLTSKS